MDDKTVVVQRVDSPTYANLFPEALAYTCSSSALESNDGPLAYAYSLYTQAVDIEKLGNKSAVPLSERRPDIGQQILDKASVEEQVAPLGLVIDILARKAAQQLGEKTPLARAIAGQRSPAQLPYNRPMQQIQAVLNLKRIAFLDLLQDTDYYSPNFCYGKLRTPRLRDSMLLSNAMPPELEALLTEGNAFEESDFYKTHFGLKDDAKSALSMLQDAHVLALQLGISVDAIREMLTGVKVSDTDATDSSSTTLRSRHLDTTQTDSTLSEDKFGSRFVNGLEDTPAVTISASKGTNAIRISNLSHQRLDRIQKMAHLQQALNLPFLEVDMLIVAALRAEGKAEALTITLNTLRALGVFRYLKTEYGVTTEQFVALIDHVSPFAKRPSIPLLDRLLSPHSATDSTLQLDGQAFDPASTVTDGTMPSGKDTVSHFCRAFGLEEPSVEALLKHVSKATDDKPLTRSLATISALYRLIHLPRILKMSPAEGACALQLLAMQSTAVMKQLAGQPQILDGDEVGVLDVIMAFSALARWLKRHRLSAQVLLLCVTDEPPAEITAARWEQLLLGDFESRLLAAQLTDSGIREALEPRFMDVTKQVSNWLEALAPILDSNGYIKDGKYNVNQEQVKTLTADVQTCLNELPLSPSLDLQQLLDVSEVLGAHIKNALIAQQDLAHGLIRVIVKDGASVTTDSLDDAVIPRLLRWAGSNTSQFLNEAHSALTALKAGKSIVSPAWFKLLRYALTIRSFKLSPCALELLLDHPDWFALEKQDSPPVLNLDLMYQLGCYQTWVQRLSQLDIPEAEAVAYLSKANANANANEDAYTPEEAAQAMAAMLGRDAAHTWDAVQAINCEVPESKNVGFPLQVKGSLETEEPIEDQKNRQVMFDDFLQTASTEARDFYKRYNFDITYLILNYYTKMRGNENMAGAKDLIDALEKFIIEQPTPVGITPEQDLLLKKYGFSLEVYKSRGFARDIKEIKFIVVQPAPAIPTPMNSPASVPFKVETSPIVATEAKTPVIAKTVSDIDFAMRLLRLSDLTGLSCTTLMTLPELNKQSCFAAAEAAARVMLANCDAEPDAAVQRMNDQLDESWRDALIASVKSAWTSSSAQKKPDNDELSSYFLTDVEVTAAAAKTTRTGHVIAGLQHYLHRLFAHLEPGYDAVAIPEEAQNAWRQYQSEYDAWKAHQMQINHPENLIYYANRPNKSKAFEELEVELNQGKLDTSLLQTAVTSYLTKFEKTSNLQVVSGYLDGVNPKQDTYHFIGKTNASPPEYYWRSLDMELRDDKGRISPLAWSEWELIGLPVSGQIVQSRCTVSDTTNANSQETILVDAIRPVVIAGRHYVFWVERATTGLTSDDPKKPRYRKLSVSYAYKQADGFWSPVNELMCLDGAVDVKNLKDETYVPALIALVNVESNRAQDPWLAVMLYNSAYDDNKTTATEKAITNRYSKKFGVANKDYFIEMRDLLLIDKKSFASPELEDIFAAVAYNSYSDLRKIQHLYTGDERITIEAVSTNHHWEGNNKDAIILKSSVQHKPAITAAPLHAMSIKYIYPRIFSESNIIEILPGRGKGYIPPSIREPAASNSFIRPPTTKSTMIRFFRLGEEYKNHQISLTFANPELDYKDQSGYTGFPPGLFLKADTAAFFEKEATLILKPADPKVTTFTFSFNINIDPNHFKTVNISLDITTPDKIKSTVITQPILASGRELLQYTYTFQKTGEYLLKLYETDNPDCYSETKIKISASDVDEIWDIFIKRDASQAQYLDLTAVTADAPQLQSDLIRLNTLFGKQLVARATQSTERLLEWASQMIKEPIIGNTGEAPPVDFHGANGGYFRELFLHLPALITTRLSENQQYHDAEEWCVRYLFDPYRTETDAQQRPPLWNSRPLAEVGSGASTLLKAVSPSARAFSLSRYCQRAVFLLLVENWQREGDQFYRKVTTSSLNHAWLSYQQALKLLGPLPEYSGVSRWVPDALQKITPDRFSRPINKRVISLRKTLESRLYDLRHGLTIDGKALPPMDLRHEGQEAFGFARNGVGSLSSTYNSLQAQIPPYRFRQLLPIAQAAVQQLKEMGQHYMALMEEEFNTSLSVLLKSQEIRLSDFTLRLKKNSIDSVAAKKSTLEVGKQAAILRKNFFSDLLQVGRSPMEEAATGLLFSSAALKTCSVPFQTAAGIIDSAVPKIYGLAFGGNNIHAPMAKTALALELAAESTKLMSDQLLVESGYERRAEVWQFEQQQAELDIKSIDLEIAEQNVELSAATVSLDEARAARANLEEAYVAMTTGFTIIPVYNWLVARQEALYAPAYDAVLSLCFSLEAAWRFERGDYQTHSFIKTTAWNDAYKGMLAGESLWLDLQQMENAYLQNNERRLSIKKTLSLKNRIQAKDWVSAIKDLAEKPLIFELKSADFDANYPGHYLRQLKHVSVSFKIESSAGENMENISALLTQTHNTTLILPDIEGAKYLYGKAENSVTTLRKDLRAQQQIALSSAVADDGLGFEKKDWAYELMFHDGRYLPFEGTGAISRWELRFPDSEFVKSLMSKDKKTAFISDIQLHVVYTAVDGGREFEKQVRDLAKDAAV
jgi:hypothetical protein